MAILSNFSFFTVCCSMLSASAHRIIDIVIIIIGIVIIIIGVIMTVDMIISSLRDYTGIEALPVKFACISITLLIGFIILSNGRTESSETASLSSNGKIVSKSEINSEPVTAKTDTVYIVIDKNQLQQLKK